MDTLDAEEREYAEKYVKMAKAGLPFPVVEHKMVAEGMPGYIQSAVKEAVEQQQQQQQQAAAMSPSPPPASASPMNTPQSLTEDDQATVQRFQKMLRLGMPPDAVQHKMMAEGTSQPVMNAVLGNTDNNIAAETPQRTNVAAPGDESIDEETLEETVEEEVTANEEEEVITEEEEVTATDEHTNQEDPQQQQQEEVFDDEEYEQHEEETVEETANGSNIYDEQQETVEAYAFPDQEQSAPANYDNNAYYNRQQQHTNYSNGEDVEYGQYNTNNYNNDPPEYRGGLKRPVATTTQNNTATNSKQQQSPQQSKIKEARKRKCLRSVLILIVLAFVLTLCGLGVLLYFWLTDDDDGDDATALRTNSTSAPTVSRGCGNDLWRDSFSCAISFSQISLLTVNGFSCRLPTPEHQPWPLLQDH